MDRTEVLLSNGYFLSQLPPAFITDHLAAQISALQVLWAHRSLVAASKPPNATTTDGHMKFSSDGVNAVVHQAVIYAIQ